MKISKILAITIASTIALSSCSNDDEDSFPLPVNEEEVITTLTATLSPVSGGETITLQLRDLDGDGPDAPVITVSGPLSIGTTYNGSLDLLNETESPAGSITEEIEEEDDEHQFFYTASNDLATFSYSDADGNGNPIGLAFTMTTSATAASGNVTIILRHEPNKTADGVSNGNIANAGGETDITATFPVVLQ